MEIYRRIDKLIKGKKETLKQGKDGVVFAIYRQDKILLEERNKPNDIYYGYTILPGGGIEKGESILDTLKREIYEECGCLPTAYHYLDFYEQREGNVVYNRHLILVTEVAGEVVDKEPEKSKHLWASIEEAKRLCKHTSTQQFLEEIESFIGGEGLNRG